MEAVLWLGAVRTRRLLGGIKGTLVNHRNRLTEHFLRPDKHEFICDTAVTLFLIRPIIWPIRTR